MWKNPDYSEKTTYDLSQVKMNQIYSFPEKKGSDNFDHPGQRVIVKSVLIVDAVVNIGQREDQCPTKNVSFINCFIFFRKALCLCIHILMLNGQQI